MSSNIPIPNDIADLTGPLLLGHLFNWGLFGALSVQAYIYYLAFPHDRFWPTKGLSTFIYIFEVAQTCVNTRDAFRNFGPGWGDMGDLDLLGTYWLGAPVMTAIISCIVQFFYAWRIWILTKQYWIPGVIMLLSLVQSVSGVYAGDWAKRINHFSEIQSETYVVTSIWLAGTALCDTLIAVSMSWTLLRARTGVRSTDALVVRIVRLSVETGTLCAAFALLDLIFYLTFKHNNFHMIPSIALTKMYSNSYFAVLNSRVRITGGRMSEVVSTDPTLSICVAAPGQSNTMVRFRGAASTYATTTDVELSHTSTDAQTEFAIKRGSADDLKPESIVHIDSSRSSPV